MDHFDTDPQCTQDSNRVINLSTDVLTLYDTRRHNALQWRHNERDTVSNHQPHDYLLNRLFRRRSKKISKLRVIGPCVGNSPVTGEFPAQMASNAENVFIWWRHHGAFFSKIVQLLMLSNAYALIRLFNTTDKDLVCSEWKRDRQFVMFTYFHVVHASNFSWLTQISISLWVVQGIGGSLVLTISICIFF